MAAAVGLVKMIRTAFVRSCCESKSALETFERGSKFLQENIMLLLTRVTSYGQSRIIKCETPDASVCGSCLTVCQILCQMMRQFGRA